MCIRDRFIYDEYNANNLRKLIKPFILRRTKSQVMTELPDKIENKFFVELNKDQRKVYSAYAVSYTHLDVYKRQTYTY